MAAALMKNHSRGPLAALTFLSNISLDGSHRDTNLALLPRNGAIHKRTFSKTCTVYEEESTDDVDTSLEEAVDGLSAECLWNVSMKGNSVHAAQEIVEHHSISPTPMGFGTSGIRQDAEFVSVEHSWHL